MGSLYISIMEHPETLECFQVLDTIARHRLEVLGKNPPLDFSFCSPKTLDDLAKVIQLLNHGLRNDVIHLAREEVCRRPDQTNPYLAVICVLVFMQLGVFVDNGDLIMTKILCHSLTSPYHQVQVWTAANEYKNNGMRWVFEGITRPAADFGHPLYNDPTMARKGIGFSLDESPFPYFHSKTCMTCNAEKPDFSCHGCRMLRFCSVFCYHRALETNEHDCAPCFQPSAVQVWYPQGWPQSHK